MANQMKNITVRKWVIVEVGIFVSFFIVVLFSGYNVFFSLLSKLSLLMFGAFYIIKSKQYFLVGQRVLLSYIISWFYLVSMTLVVLLKSDLISGVSQEWYLLGYLLIAVGLLFYILRLKRQERSKELQYSFN